MVEGLLLRRPAVGRDRLIPFLGIVEHRIDIEDDAAKGIEPVPDDLSDREFGIAPDAFGIQKSPVASRRARNGIPLYMGWSGNPQAAATGSTAPSIGATILPGAITCEVDDAAAHRDQGRRDRSEPRRPLCGRDPGHAR